MFKKLLAVGTALGICLADETQVSAQGMFDQFAFPRVIVAAGAQSVGGVGVTNGWIDTHGYNGIARFDLTSYTVAGNSLNFTIQTSPDQTNITTLANAAYATVTPVVYTNLYYGGSNLVATNTFNLAGTFQTITAGTAGFAAPYAEVIAPALFTNTVSGVTFTNATQTNTVFTLGYNIGDANRYVRVAFYPGATSTNIVTAVLTARKQGF